jgi:hypothetical protein
VLVVQLISAALCVIFEIPTPLMVTTCAEAFETPANASNPRKLPKNSALYRIVVYIKDE